MKNTLTTEKQSLQEKYGANGICFGCGPKNEKGLQIKTFVEGEEFVVRFKPKPEHRAFEGVVNGGIIGAIFDCHCNWISAYVLHKQAEEKEFPSTVTAEFTVKLKRPTPYGVELIVKGRTTKIDGNKVYVEAEMHAGEKITALCTGLFVAVDKTHPGYHRWGN